MKKIEDDLKNIFSEEKIPEISSAKLEELNALVRENKKDSKMPFLKYALISVCCVVAILGVLIPVIRHFNKTESPRYYSDSTVNRVALTQEYVQNYIYNNYQKYYILFERCNYEKSSGYYAPDTNKLLAIHINMQEKDIPNTNVALLLVVDNHFIFEEEDNYIENAEIINNENYVLYKKTLLSTFNEMMSGYFKHKSYSIFLKLNIVNEDLFNIFL